VGGKNDLVGEWASRRRAVVRSNHEARSPLILIRPRACSSSASQVLIGESHISFIGLVNSFCTRAAKRDGSPGSIAIYACPAKASFVRCLPIAFYKHG